MDMIKVTAAAAALMLGAAALSAPVLAQGAVQTIGVAQIDMKSIASGYRSSKIVGSSVYNQDNQNVGKIDDLIVSTDGKTPFAILSVGGFLGVGAHLIAVPFQALKFAQDKITLPNAGKDELKKMPEFAYVTK